MSVKPGNAKTPKNGVSTSETSMRIECSLPPAAMFLSCRRSAPGRWTSSSSPTQRAHTAKRTSGSNSTLQIRIPCRRGHEHDDRKVAGTRRSHTMAAESTDLIYLDFNATTPILPEVLEVMLPYLRDDFGNPSSDHPKGTRARDGVEAARCQVASLIGASSAEIIFTSCATESSNLAIRGVAAARSQAARIVTSTIEHPASSQPCNALESAGWTVTRVAPRSSGLVHPDDVQPSLGPDVAL